MELEEVNYVSVKISAIVSQLIEVDHDGSVNRVAEKLRKIYSKAQKESVFVNLDMEEYRDLEVTIDVFKKLLDDVKPAAEVLGAVLPIWTGPTFIKPVLGEAVLSAKNNPGLVLLLFKANSPAPNLTGKGLSFAVLDLRV